MLLFWLKTRSIWFLHFIQICEIQNILDILLNQSTVFQFNITFYHLFSRWFANIKKLVFEQLDVENEYD